MSYANNNERVQVLKDTKEDCKYDVRAAIDLLAELKSCNRIPADFDEGVRRIIDNAYAALEAL